MIITFKSTIKRENEEDTIIEFEAPVEITKMNEYNVYEFLEPQNKIMNRIEVSEKRVNIFAGPSTVILVLNELIQNDYYTQEGTIMFDSEMKELKIEKETIDFSYTLGQLNNPFGEFNINLKIKK
ncbi:MAG: DUF1934 family protein [Mycoplasmataceae bacterium]|nr:DUF1934 family protein [Mycoplasmataceae bacterium]